MRKLTASLLLLIAGWALGWYSHEHWGQEPVMPLVQTPPAPVDDMLPVRDLPGAAGAPIDVLQQLLSASDFDGGGQLRPG